MRLSALFNDLILFYKTPWWKSKNILKGMFWIWYQTKGHVIIKHDTPNETLKIESNKISNVSNFRGFINV